MGMGSVHHRRRQLLNRNGEEDMVSFSSFLLLLLYFFCWLYASLADFFVFENFFLFFFLRFFTHSFSASNVNLRTTSLLISGLEPCSLSQTSRFDILSANNNKSSNSNLNPACTVLSAASPSTANTRPGSAAGSVGPNQGRVHSLGVE